MKLYEKYKTLLSNYGLNTFLRLAHFFAQIHHESGLKLVRESCYYTTIDGLRKTFKTPFVGKSDAFVRQYLRNSEKCANYVYANRGGNGDEKSGDGFKFRGGGYLQNTFKQMYEWLTEQTGINFVENPDLILIESNALIAALAYWKSHNLNVLADKDNLDNISDIVNLGHPTVKKGDSNGFENRALLLNKYKIEISNYLKQAS